MYRRTATPENNSRSDEAALEEYKTIQQNIQNQELGHGWLEANVSHNRDVYANALQRAAQELQRVENSVFRLCSIDPSHCNNFQEAANPTISDANEIIRNANGNLDHIEQMERQLEQLQQMLNTYRYNANQRWLEQSSTPPTSRRTRRYRRSS
ncbi:MAG: hypothetical protein Sylvanvirus25_7 [Sylvanvirus sp.]|uniref:Uncharacterized protein n=1 Tax=Sylvanvirus sp. TaxID=2487774 RepID=A0A3G5AIS8_9VIRU|nr:MAG: hypothetical protein Sylvanvirus25_7 [Sylvanvirus sp.]